MSVLKNASLFFFPRASFPCYVKVCPVPRCVTCWSCQGSATSRPPPPPAGQPAASLPRPEKAVQWEMYWGRGRESRDGRWGKSGRGKKKKKKKTEDRLLECGVLTQTRQWGKPHVIAHMGWLTQWDRVQAGPCSTTKAYSNSHSELSHTQISSLFKSHRVTLVLYQRGRKCSSRLPARSYRSSASPPMQTGLFSLESRL